MENEDLKVSEATKDLTELINNAVNEIGEYLLKLKEAEPHNAHFAPALANGLAENFKLKLIQKVL